MTPPQLVSPEWPLRLFRRSLLKQQKWRELVAQVGPTAGRRCLDVGSDNGVISLLFRQCGGHWASADLDAGRVAAIRALVGSEVYQLDGGQTPFGAGEFDCVVLVDVLEHLPDDAGFVRELARIVRPGGVLVVNVPHAKEGVLRWLRHALGQSDEQHGHLRPGYTLDSLRALLEPDFAIERQRTYSRFFTEMIDALIVFALAKLKRGRRETAQKGMLVTGGDLAQHRALFRAYSLLYPLVWLFARLDGLLFFTSGYLLIVRARRVEH